jgi:hypothetical protein
LGVRGDGEAFLHFIKTANAIRIYSENYGSMQRSGAAEGTRTPDPIITNDVLYQLSYSGNFLLLGPDWPYWIFCAVSNQSVWNVNRGWIDRLRLEGSENA